MIPRIIYDSNPVADSSLQFRLEQFQQAGFSFFPLINHSKKPRTKWEKFHQQQPEPREIDNWLYLQHPNYGIVTGAISGNILGIDVDPAKMDTDPTDWLRRWPTGYIVQTPTGGLHLVFRLPDDIRVQCSSDELAPGIDTRGEGGYLVAPGSTVVYRGEDAIKKNVPDGHQGTYTQIGTGDIAAAPDELLALLHAKGLIIGQKPPRSSHSEPRSQTYPDATTQQIAEALAFVPTQGPYVDWLRCCMAVHSVCPDQRGIDLIEAWSPGYEGEVAEKFKSFEKDYAGPKVTLGTLIWLAKQHGYQPPKALQPEADPKSALQADITVNQPYITADLLAGDHDLVIISDMGTGKSTAVAKLPGQKLIPSHRVRLSNALARPFEAKDYRDEHNKIRPGHELINLWNQGFNLTIVINSLHRLAEAGPLPKIPIVFIDECRQVLDQFGGGTFKGGAEAETVFNTFCAIIRHAERVIVADAHADATTIQFIKDLRGPDRVKVIVNTYERPRGRLTIYRHQDRLIAKVCELVDEDSGQAVVVPTNSKTQANKLGEYFNVRYGAAAVMVVHQDTTDARTRHFIEHIADEINRYRVVIYSPTLGSGIDINHDSQGNQIEVRAICALLQSNVTTASDGHQLINRCRNTLETHVYLQQSDGHRETDPNALYERRLAEAIKTGHVAHFDHYGVRVASESQQQLHRLVSNLEASNNASMNHYHPDFLRLAKGYVDIEVNDEIDESTREDLQETAQEVAEQDKQAVLLADPVDPDTYRRLRDTNLLTPAILAGYQRWQIEQAAGGQSITPDLYDLLHDPANRARLYQLVDYLHVPLDELKERDRQDAASLIHKRRHYARRKLLITRLITDLYGPEGLHTRPLTRGYIHKTVDAFLTLNGTDLFGVFHKRHDESTEPLAVFRWFITEVLGLAIETHRKQTHGKRIYRYSLNATILKRQLALAARHHGHRQKEPIQLWLPLPGEADPGEE